MGFLEKFAFKYIFFTVSQRLRRSDWQVNLLRKWDKLTQRLKVLHLGFTCQAISCIFRIFLSLFMLYFLYIFCNFYKNWKQMLAKNSTDNISSLIWQLWSYGAYLCISTHKKRLCFLNEANFLFVCDFSPYLVLASLWKQKALMWICKFFEHSQIFLKYGFFPTLCEINSEIKEWRNLKRSLVFDVQLIKCICWIVRVWFRKFSLRLDVFCGKILL